VETAKLRLSSQDEPGISRRRCGRGFRYLRPDGSPVTAAAELARVKALVIPPRLAGRVDLRYR
jgi:DNA topoisomerase IB